MCNIEVKAGTTLKIFNVVSIIVMVVLFPPSLIDYVIGLKLNCYSHFFLIIYSVIFVSEQRFYRAVTLNGKQQHRFYIFG